MASALGTPGYMAPEAALGHVEHVDRRSDIYSLGAILFEILTGRLPFSFDTFAECMSQLATKDPPEARALEPGVPQALSDLCERALSRVKKDRPESAEALAAEVRAWQAQSALEKEVDGLLRDAKATLDAAAQARGDARLRQVDRAAGALERVASRQTSNPTALRYRKRAAALREDGIRERERASGRRLLVRIAAAVLVVATVAGFVVAGVLNQRRREAEQARSDSEAARAEATTALEREQEARSQAAAERDATGRALAQVLRLADAKKARDLSDAMDGLWPVHPDRAPVMAQWLEDAQALLQNRGGHEQALAKLRERGESCPKEQHKKESSAKIERIEALRAELASKKEPPEDEAKRTAWFERWAAADKELKELEAPLATRASWSFQSAEDDWRHQVLSDLLDDLSRVDAGRGAIAERLRTARTLKARSIEAYRAHWADTVKAIAASPKYGRMEIVPQLGLVPLGADPESGLCEFAQVGTGTIPKRDPGTKRLVLTDDFAIVLVLIPGGTFRMGAQETDAKAPNHDPEAAEDESPVHEVTLGPYFLSKYECTQAQWEKMTTERPSAYGPGEEEGVTLRDPVECVSWNDCTLWLSRYNLMLPTEAQWEHACRAGTDTPWFTGRELGALEKVANLADASFASDAVAHWPFTKEIDDGFVVHAPVGSLAANGFGLFDVHGNVWEWCRDTWSGYPAEPVTEPLARGG
ncbi:MAG: SUMF1/EgtB/PvdO family nonheme iron enzyme, partial [Planctomycetota bacterium]